MSMYAAYGPNMHPERMSVRAPHSPMAGTGWLHGWRLTFCGEDLAWDGPLPTLVEQPRSRVFVVLYDVADDDQPSLDQWEGAELGMHRTITARIATGPADHMLAWLYVMDAYEGGVPSAWRLGLIADAAEAAGAPASYVRELRSRPCLNVGPGSS